MTSSHALKSWLATSIAAVSEVASHCNGRVYDKAVRQGDPLPSVVFSLLDSDDVNTQMSVRGATTHLVQVAVWDASESAETAMTVYGAVDDLLQGASAEHEGWRIDCYRRSEIDDVVVDKGDVSVMAGGLYEIWLRTLTE